jgi:hypothetical protein
MPALSQNLVFKITNGNTTTNTVQLAYPNTATTALVYNSEKIRGDGYFGGSDGLHTVLWSVSQFSGAITIQGTLASEPQEADWSTVNLTSANNNYSVDTTGLVRPGNTTATVYTTATTDIKSYNFTGNFVWLRGKVSNFTHGMVYNISINR